MQPETVYCLLSVALPWAAMEIYAACLYCYELVRRGHRIAPQSTIGISAPTHRPAPRSLPAPPQRKAGDASAAWTGDEWFTTEDNTPPWAEKKQEDEKE